MVKDSDIQAKAASQLASQINQHTLSKASGAHCEYLRSIAQPYHRHQATVDKGAPRTIPQSDQLKTHRTKQTNEKISTCKP